MKLRTLSLLLIGSALSACNMTQPPAQVVMKGSNFYGTPNGKPVRMASMTPEQAAMGAPVAHVSPGSGASSRPSAKTYASAAPSYPAAQAMPTQPRQAQAAAVTVRDLAPLTPAKMESAPTPAPARDIVQAPAPVTETSGELAVAEAPALDTQKAPTLQEPKPETAPSQVLAVKEEELSIQPGVLPEPQARTVAETKAIADASAASGKGFIWPVKGKVISEFGSKKDGEYNDGINIAAQQGEPIVAAADGEVVYSGNELRGYGNMVIVRHDNGLMTAYAHADRILVSKGERVKQGVAIATVGKSGGVNQAQVHFGVRKNKEPVDPMTVLGGNSLALKN